MLDRQFGIQIFRFALFGKQESSSWMSVCLAERLESFQSERRQNMEIFQMFCIELQWSIIELRRAIVSDSFENF